ncbi:MAG: cobalt ECF transporter T component CbiQ [Candidatus Adiutrix sp.]|jgi:cobalt/nickel transport system permease protein|nr:cobalt ECF transporter T component CbiQ [Candidatus Adiutrix sp.]
MTCRHLTHVSLVQRLDPRLKIVAAAAWSFLLALSPALPAALGGLAGSLALTAAARPDWRETLRRLGVVNFFVLFMWLMLPFSFSTPGEVLARLGFLELTREGLKLAVLLTVKANGVALGAMALLGSAPPRELAAAARRLGAPEKLAAMFLLMIRYFQLIRQEYERLRVAMRARAFRAGPNLHSYRTLANLVGLMLVRGLDRAERVHAAMLCRGYQGRFWIDGQFSPGGLDWAAGAVLLLMMAGVLGLNFMAGA